MNILIGFLIFSIVIIFHEFGHFLFAKLSGIKVLGCSAGILGYSIAEMKAFEENLSYKNQPFSYKNDILDI